MPKKPDAYKMKTRSRAGMIAAIPTLAQRHYDNYDPYHLCFNVKCYSVDLDLPNMLAKWREYEGDPAYTHNPEWLKAVKERYDEHDEHLFDWGIEDARRHFVDDGPGQSDTFRTLWDGTEVDVEYAFIGRSGGWLAVTKFEGYRFDERGTSLDEILEEMDTPTIKKLYQLLLMLKHDTRQEAVKNEVEHQAAFCFFANICSDITKSNHIQGQLFETETEAEILAGVS